MKSPSTTTWSIWADRLLAVLVVGLFLSLSLSWMAQYASPDGNPGIIDSFSHTVVDASWMPPGTETQYPLLGEHYFGDYWINRGYAEAATPYIISGMPAQYPPVAIFVFRLVTLVPPLAGLVLQSVLGLLLLAIFGWRLSGSINRSRRILAIVVVVGMSAPTLLALDRGGHQLVAVGLLGISLLFARRQRFVIAGVLLVVAISLKSYLAIFLIYPLFRGYWRFALSTGLGTVLINALLLLTFPGRPTVSLAGILSSTSYYSGPAGLDHILGGSSFASLMSYAISLFQTQELSRDFVGSSLFAISIAGVAWLGVVAFLLTRPSVPYYAGLVLVLSSGFVLVSASYAYNYAAMILAAFMFMNNGSDPFPRLVRKQQESYPAINADSSLTFDSPSLRWGTLIVLTATLVPQFWGIEQPGGGWIPGHAMVAPLSVIALTVVAVVLALRSVRNQMPSDPRAATDHSGR